MGDKKKRPMLPSVGDTTFDKIKAFYMNPEEFPLSDTLEAIRCRWVVATSFAAKSYGKIEIANMLVRDYGIKPAQAYIDIRNAENIFGSISQTNKDAAKAMWIEQAKDLLKRCLQKGDRTNEVKALLLIAQYSDWEDDKMEFNPEKLENKEIQIVLPKQMLDVLKGMVGTGVVDFNNLNVTDINFEDLTDGVD